MIVRMWHGKVPSSKAKYYPEDKDYLLEFEPKVVHYEVVGQS